MENLYGIMSLTNITITNPQQQTQYKTHTNTTTQTRQTKRFQILNTVPNTEQSSDSN